MLLTFGPWLLTSKSTCSFMFIGCSSIRRKSDIVRAFLPTLLNSGEMSGFARSKKKAHI